MFYQQVIHLTWRWTTGASFFLLCLRTRGGALRKPKRARIMAAVRRRGRAAMRHIAASVSAVALGLGLVAVATTPAHAGQYWVRSCGNADPSAPGWSRATNADPRALFMPFTCDPAFPER